MLILRTMKPITKYLRYFQHFYFPQNYFYEDVLEISESISKLDGFNGKVMCANIVAFFIVYLCIIKGIKSTGKISYLTAPMPYILLSILLIR